MNTNEHLLTCLSEECAEIQYQISKALRFGFDDIPPGEMKTNAELIKFEFIDLMAVYGMCVEAGLLEDIDGCGEQLIEKTQKVRKWLQYAKQRGTLTEMPQAEAAP